MNPHSKMRYLRFISPHLSRVHKSAPQNPSFLNLNLTRDCASTTSQPSSSKPPPPPPPAGSPSEKVAAIVDEISGLTLLEVTDLTEVLRKKLDINEMPIMGVMMPGMGFGAMRGGAGRGGGGAAAAKGEEKVEKTAFDLKLEGFEAAAKIKVIKEVRSFTDLGLKEAKDLVEKTPPTLLKKGVTKEEAEKIIQKMKDIGAKVVMD